MLDATPNRSKELLAVVYYYPPVNVVGALRPNRFVKYLTQAGYVTEVIASNCQPGLQSGGGVQFVPDNPNQGTDRLWVFLSRLMEKICRNGGDRLEWLPPAISAGLRALRRKPDSVLLTSYPPLSSSLAGAFLQWRTGATWIADFRDPFADSPFRGQVRLRFTELWLERIMFSRASAVLIVTDVLAGEMRQRHPMYAHKIHTLWNGFDPAEPIGPRPKAPRSFEVLAHIGDLYGARHPGKLLQSLVRLNRQLHIIQIGSQDVPGFEAMPEVRQLISEGLFELKPERVPRAAALDQISTADRLLLLDMNDQNVGHTVPGKLFDYVLTGHPILAFTPTGSTVQWILERCGVPFTAIDPLAEPDVVDREVTAFLRIPAIPVPPSQWFMDHFDGEQQTQHLMYIIETCVAGRR